MSKIETAAELLPEGELVDVRFLELSGVIRSEPRENFESNDVEQSLTVMVGTGPRVVEVRVEATVGTLTADYRVVAATQFKITSEAEFTEEAAGEFAERVGVMAVYPYLREAVQSMSARLREEPPVTMPLMRQASLTKFEPDSAAE